MLSLIKFDNLENWFVKGQMANMGFIYMSNKSRLLTHILYKNVLIWIFDSIIPPLLITIFVCFVNIAL